MQMNESARRWGALWGFDPDAWAINEAQQTPVYEAALRATGLEPGARVLDVGCGTGVFLRLCADRGAEVAGVDAAAGLLDLARDARAGRRPASADMADLPYADDSFDLVTGFTSFFFADDIVRALSEARRVARPGAPVIAGVRPPGPLRPRGVKAAVALPPRGRARVLAARDAVELAADSRPAVRAGVRRRLRLSLPGRGCAHRGDARRGRRGLLAGPERVTRCAPRSSTRSPTAARPTGATTWPTSGT